MGMTMLAVAAASVEQESSVEQERECGCQAGLEKQRWIRRCTQAGGVHDRVR